MTRDEQIAGLRHSIDDINAKIKALEAASPNPDPSEQDRIDAQIAVLQQTRQPLENALNTLESSPVAFELAGGVTPAAARRTVAAHRKAAVKDLLLAASNTNKRAKELLKVVKVPKSKQSAKPAKKK